MKRLVLPLWCVMALLSFGAAQASQLPTHGNGGSKPLRPVSKCLDGNSINELYMISDTTLIARNGPRRYLVTTTHKCPRLGKHGQSVRFHTSHGKMGDFRICGDIGETVASRFQPPCAIKSVQLISAEKFDALEKQARHDRSK